MNPTPTLDQAYVMIIQEESQRMNGGILENAPMEGVTSGLISANASNMRPKSNAHLQCDYCHLKGYTRKTCYKLVGYPPGFEFTNKKKEAYDGPATVAHNVYVKEDL